VDTHVLTEPINTRLPKTDQTPLPAPAPPLRVALLEHDEALREQILPGLRRYGFEVTPMRTTGELQQALLNAEFDLCILDSVLSYGDGISLPHWLRGQYPQMGLVIFSAHADPGEQLRGLNEGADAYLLKPAPVDVVAATLSSIARRLHHRPLPPLSAPARTQFPAPNRQWE